MPKLEQFAVILYTVRDSLTTRENARITFRKLANIGLGSVQVSGMPAGLFTEEELVDELGAAGLKAIATHEPGTAILNETDKVIERLKKLDVKYTAYPYPAGIDYKAPESISELIRGLNLAGKKFFDAGLVLMYHNHHHEFYKAPGQTKCSLERIYDETNPDYLQGEPDTYWIQAGGGSPVGWIERLSGRVPVIHMKDYRLDADLKPVFAEIGQGNIDFKAVVKAAEKAGTEYYVVEQDVCSGSPFDSLAISFRYIQENLVTAL